MNIVIYDTNHFETTYAIMRIFDSSQYKIVVFTSDEMRSILISMLGQDASNYEIFGVSKNIFCIKKVVKYCNLYKIDFLFLITISYNHIFWNFAINTLHETKVFLTVHDANGTFKPAFLKTPKGIIRYVGKKLLVKSVNGYFTLTSITCQYIIDRFKSKKPIYIIPGGVYEKDESKIYSLAKTFKIVIPGSIDLNRRDYSKVLQLISLSRKISKPIEIILLGTANSIDSKKVLERCYELNNDIVKVTVYNESFISQNEYDFQLATSSLVLLPLLKNTIQDDSLEIYGITKISGVFFDAIRHGKPLLIPKYIHVPQELQDQCLYFDDIEHLAGIIAELVLNSVKFEEIKKSAILNSNQFTPKKIRQKLKYFFYK